MLVARVHVVRHGDRSLLPQAAHQLAEQIPGLLLAQAEGGKPGRQPPARFTAQIDPQQSTSLQGLTVVGGDQLRHQPQGGLPLTLLPGTTAFEDMRPVRRAHQVERDVIHVSSLIVGGGAGQGVEDQSPVLDGLVAGFQIGREEGGCLRLSLNRSSLRPSPG